MQISDIQNPWRQILLSEPASFRGEVFHVETGNRTSGRRVVTHEYPKKNQGYSEDMGRHIYRFSFNGYLIYSPRAYLYDYTTQRIRLLKALDDDDAGMLIHPVFYPGGIRVVCERYSMTESRERGGYTTFDMSFVEAGQPGNTQAATDTVGKVNSTADNNDRASSAALNVPLPQPRPQDLGGASFAQRFGEWPA